MLYRITDGTLAIGGENLLEHFDFEIKGRERIAITGPNGSGKTTFLRLIAGELFLARDDRRQGEGIYLARNVTIGMLRQQIFENTAHTVQEEMMCLPERLAKLSATEFRRQLTEEMAIRFYQSHIEQQEEGRQ